MHAELRDMELCDEVDVETPTPHSVMWYKRRKPRHKAHHRASRFR
jgi:hypothetical protein